MFYSMSLEGLNEHRKYSRRNVIFKSGMYGYRKELLVIKGIMKLFTATRDVVKIRGRITTLPYNVV
jgi:hypothetical protein